MRCPCFVFVPVFFSTCTVSCFGRVPVLVMLNCCIPYDFFRCEHSSFAVSFLECFFFSDLLEKRLSRRVERFFFFFFPRFFWSAVRRVAFVSLFFCTSRFLLSAVVVYRVLTYCCCCVYFVSIHEYTKRGTVVPQQVGGLFARCGCGDSPRWVACCSRNHTLGGQQRG